MPEHNLRNSNMRMRAFGLLFDLAFAMLEQVIASMHELCKHVRWNVGEERTLSRAEIFFGGLFCSLLSLSAADGQLRSVRIN